jgi:hypothetical protein
MGFTLHLILAEVWINLTSPKLRRQPPVEIAARPAPTAG